MYLGLNNNWGDIKVCQPQNVLQPHQAPQIPSRNDLLSCRILHILSYHKITCFIFTYTVLSFFYNMQSQQILGLSRLKYAFRYTC